MHTPSCLTSAPNCQLKVTKELLDYYICLRSRMLNYNTFAVTCLPYVWVEGLYRKKYKPNFQQCSLSICKDLLFSLFSLIFS